MARNSPLLPRPRRRARPTREKTAAAPMPDDVRTVYGWLTRLTPDPAETEPLLADILRRSRAGSPACLEAASDVTRLQFQTVSSVLRLRGVL